VDRISDLESVLGGSEAITRVICVFGQGARSWIKCIWVLSHCVRSSLAHRYPFGDEYVHTSLPDLVHSSRFGSLGCISPPHRTEELCGLRFDVSRREEPS
jgi:hypothetical protein